MDSSPLGHPALTDDLTGLPNRLHFEAVYRVVFRAVNRGIPVSVAVLEVDGYVAGSEEGLAMVKRAGERLRPTVRGADLLARVDAARFFLLLFDCNPQGARIAADRYQEHLSIDGITVSVGVASTARGESPRDPRELISAAEDALARARTMGGGEVEVVLMAR